MGLSPIVYSYLSKNNNSINFPLNHELWGKIFKNPLRLFSATSQAATNLSKLRAWLMWLALRTGRSSPSWSTCAWSETTWESKTHTAEPQTLPTFPACGIWGLASVSYLKAERDDWLIALFHLERRIGILVVNQDSLFVTEWFQLFSSLAM